VTIEFVRSNYVCDCGFWQCINGCMFLLLVSCFKQIYNVYDCGFQQCSITGMHVSITGMHVSITEMYVSITGFIIFLTNKQCFSMLELLYSAKVSIPLKHKLHEFLGWNFCVVQKFPSH